MSSLLIRLSKKKCQKKEPTTVSPWGNRPKPKTSGKRGNSGNRGSRGDSEGSGHQRNTGRASHEGRLYMTGVPAPYQPVPVESRSSTRPGQVTDQPVDLSRAHAEARCFAISNAGAVFGRKGGARGKICLFVCLVFFLFRPRHRSMELVAVKLDLSTLPKKTIAKCAKQNMQPLPPKQGLGGSRLVGDYHGPSSGSNYSIGPWTGSIIDSKKRFFVSVDKRPTRIAHCVAC